MNWASGYNVEEGYTFGYYLEQDPVWMELAALSQGVSVPSLAGTDPLRLIDFGCGQGVSLAMVAACRPEVECVGIDFHPVHIAHARELAHRCGLRNVTFVESDFRRLAAAWPQELGRFTYAVAHGVQTWVAPEISEALVRCYDQALIPGGLLYVGYNCWPGWLPLVPLQHLWYRWYRSSGLPSTKALAFGRARFGDIVQASPLLTKALPSLPTSLGELDRRDRTYLAQEFLNGHWRPLWFDEVHAMFEEAKLTYVGSAAAQEWFLAEMLPETMRAVLARCDTMVDRELVCDVLINRSFRRDLWAKGAPRLLEQERWAQVGAVAFIGLKEPADPGDGRGPYRYATILGQVVGKPEVYAQTYRQVFAGPTRFVDLVQGAVPAEVLQRLGFAAAAGHVGVFRPLSDPAPAIRLNRALAERALHGGPYRFQIAVDVPHVMMFDDLEMGLIALYRDFGVREADRLGEDLATIKERLGQRLRREDGSVITESAEARDRLRQQAERFLSQSVPMLARLGVLRRLDGALGG